MITRLGGVTNRLDEYGSTWNLNDMELMDIAYTLDQLEAGNYTEEEEIFLDENDQIGN